MNFSITTRGEKIKEFRKSLNIRQEELSGKDVTRNLVSMIETNKVPLSSKAEKVIYNNFKRIIAKKGLEIEQKKIDDIFVTEKEQGRNILINYLENMKTTYFDFEKELDRLITILNEYGLNEEKSILYLALGKKYLAKREYVRSYRYFFTAYEIGVNGENIREEFILAIDDFGQALMEVGEGNFTNLELLEKISDKYQGDIDLLHKNYFAYYKGRILWKLGRKREAVSVLNKFRQNHKTAFKKHFHIVRTFSFLAEIYNELDKYNKAHKIYDEMLKFYEGRDNQCGEKIFVLWKIISLNRKNEADYKELLEKIEVIMEEDNFNQLPFINKVNKELGHAYKNMFEYKKAFKKYELARSYTTREQDQRIIDECLSSELEIAAIVEDSEEINSFKREILEALKMKKISINSNSMTQILSYYSTKGDFNKMLSVLEFCQKNI